MKTLISLLIISLFAIFALNTYFKDKDVNSEKSNKITPNTTLNKIDLETSSSIPNHLTVNKFVEAKTSIKHSINGVCGTNIEYLQNSTAAFFKKKPATEEQSIALELFNSECIIWYEYLNLLSEESRIELSNKINEAKIMNRFFYEDINTKNLIKVEEARAIMSTGGDSSMLTTSALNYLLIHDNNLIKKIASELGTKNPMHITRNKYRIGQLYQCEIDPNYCKKNSQLMNLLCLTDENVCGMTHQQAISSFISPNQYLDLLNMVSIIRNLIRQNYFEDISVLDNI